MLRGSQRIRRYISVMNTMKFTYYHHHHPRLGLWPVPASTHCHRFLGRPRSLLPPGLQLRACFGSPVFSVLSRWLIQFCLYWSLTSYIPEISSSFLITSLLILSSPVYPVTLLTKHISAASRPVMSLFVVTHVSLQYSSDGLATTL